MIKVRDISDYINNIAPYSTKCSWDNCGLLVGDADKEVNKIALALDLTSETLSKAKEFGADLIITHHPIIFKPQSSFTKGNLAYELAVSGMSAISAHTCFDCTEGGVNDVLCELLSITDPEGIPDAECVVPMARIGNIEPASSDDFASFVAEKLNTVTVKIRSASGADGRLYGAVTAKDIAEALQKDFGITVDKRKLELPDTIKSYGSYSVSVKLYTDVVGKFTVVVHE